MTTTIVLNVLMTLLTGGQKLSLPVTLASSHHSSLPLLVVMLSPKYLLTLARAPPQNNTYLIWANRETDNKRIRRKNWNPFAIEMNHWGRQERILFSWQRIHLLLWMEGRKKDDNFIYSWLWIAFESQGFRNNLLVGKLWQRSEWALCRITLKDLLSGIRFTKERSSDRKSFLCPFYIGQ